MTTPASLTHPDGRTTYDPPRRITGWHIHVLCPDCDSTLAHVADGRPDGTTSRALARCIGCDKRWKAEITLKDVTAGRGR